MKAHTGPVYEVTLCVDRELAGDLDSWLAAHVEEMLDVAGFVGADTYALDDDEDRVRRVTCYYVESDAHLESYLEGEAEERRQPAIDRFGARFSASRRILRPSDGADTPAEPPRCLNCDTVAIGQYCGQCGQRASSRLISIWELLRDAFGDLFELDSRLWRTLIPLAIRPGLLTRDYLRGRRARYMPPFRMYIVLSLAFFLIVFFNPRESLGILFAEDTTGAVPESSVAEQAAAEIRSEMIAGDPDADDSDEDDVGLSLTIDGNALDRNCDLSNFDSSDMPNWLARRLTKDRLQVMCDRLIAEDGTGVQGLVDKLVDNVPVGLFILLPIMALVLKILYPLSKRYYVEHLLFVVHYHAFIFLALSTQVLFSRFNTLVGLPDAIDEIVGISVSVYILVYLYRALRRVYGQRRWVTLPKLALLLSAYVAGLSLILMIAVIFAAFSV
jgi:hypothetical protein